MFSTPASGNDPDALRDHLEREHEVRRDGDAGTVADWLRGLWLGLYKNLEIVAEEVTSDHPILVQERGGGLPRGELVRKFKADTHSSLFGTDSFWTGIDVVGESLTAVVIDKIPFEHQDDPLIAAMKEASDEEFWPWYTNRAIIRLRQGVGRLIRSQTDIGVIVILDERIKTKKYGLQMAKALGPSREPSDREGSRACSRPCSRRNPGSWYGSRRPSRSCRRRSPRRPETSRSSGRRQASRVTRSSSWCRARSISSGSAWPFSPIICRGSGR
jgi:hypothetical protein